MNKITWAEKIEQIFLVENWKLYNGFIEETRTE